MHWHVWPRGPPREHGNTLRGHEPHAWGFAKSAGFGWGLQRNKTGRHNRRAMERRPRGRDSPLRAFPLPAVPGPRIPDRTPWRRDESTDMGESLSEALMQVMQVMRSKDGCFGVASRTRPEIPRGCLDRQPSASQAMRPHVDSLASEANASRLSSSPNRSRNLVLLSQRRLSRL